MLCPSSCLAWANSNWYSKPRASRAYPIYYTKRRCYALRVIAHTFYASMQGTEMAPKEKCWELIKAITSTRRTMYSTLWTYVGAVLREVLCKMRLMDTTRTSYVRQLLLVAVDVTDRLRRQMNEAQPHVQVLMRGSDAQKEED